MLAPIDRPVVCPIIVGREHYLDLLDGILAAAGRGEGQTVLLAGEAGVGKTRLVSEVKGRAAGHGLTVLQGNCFETDRSLPYAPVLDMLRALLAVHRPDEISRWWAPYAAELIKLLPELQTLVPGIAPSPPLELEQEKRRLFDAICGFLSTMSGTRPLLVVVEDLHWADDTSLDFLLYMARRIVQLPALLLATYRSDEARHLSRFLAALDRERLSSEVRLDRLPIDDVDAMVRAIFQLKRPIRGEFLETMYSLTEGNAFFIEEVLKSLLAAGDIFYEKGEWERKPMQELHIPRTVQDAVGRRAESLSAAAKHTLALAAVVGRRFDFALLQALTGYDEGALLGAIKELMSAQLVVEESVDRFAFRHALTCQAIYSELLARERRLLHTTIAQTMLTLYTDSIDAHVADLAYHCSEAGMHPEALEYSRAAGENAHALYSPRAAVEHFTRAIQASRHMPNAPPSLFIGLHRSRGPEYETLGEFDLARGDYEAALDGSRQALDARGEWEALLDLGKLWAGRDYSIAGDYFRQALDLARSMDDPLALAHSLNRVGNWYANIDQPYDAISLHREAMDIFDALEDKRGTAESVDLLGMTTYLSGDLLGGAACYERAIQLFTELNDKQGLCSALAMIPLCSAATYHSDTLVGVDPNIIDGVEECLHALAIARDIGWRAGEAFSLWMLGFCLGMRGDYGVALNYAQAAMSTAREIGHSQWMTASGGTLGSIYTDLFALDQARAILEESAALAKETGSFVWTRITAGLLASCCTAQGDFDRAQAVLDEAMPPDLRWETFGQRRCWQARAELAAARGDYDEALAVIERLYSNVLRPGSDPNLGVPRLAMMKGEILLSLGRPAEAEQWLLPALEGAMAHLSSSLVWRIQLLLGRVYVALSRPDEAAMSFTQSRALVEHLASTLPNGEALSDQLRACYLAAVATRNPELGLRSAGDLPSHSTPQSKPRRRAPGGLTARELEVANLVAQGKTNREIADQLVLGERTIETHVGNVLSQLGFTSRAQIAAWATKNL